MNENIINKPSKYSKDYLTKLFQYSLGEDIGNAVTHCVGALFALGALSSLSWVAGRYGNAVDAMAFIIYGLSILFLFTMSTIYHSMINHTARSVFKKMDHIAILIMITGSYTPYVFSLVKSPKAYLIYAILIIMTIMGIIFKSLYAGKFKIISTLIYVIMGWLAVLLMPDIIRLAPIAGFYYMLASGLTYTVGAILYAFGKFKYSHMIWHLFVLVAAVLMFISINFYILQYRVI